MIPGLREAIELALQQAGEIAPIVREFRPIPGGDTNHSARIETARGLYFIKWQDGAPEGFFESERTGLAALASAGVRTPRAITTGSIGTISFLLLEWVETDRKTDWAAEELGRMLATLHRESGPRYGFPLDNFIGPLAQPNTQAGSWIAFYGLQRLGAQKLHAERRGYMPAQRARRLDRLISMLGNWIDEGPLRPRLIHGDLWGGNWIVDRAGHPLLIDPAVSYGDREMDLAMARLFGSFPERFFSAYQEAHPLLPGWESRVELYQLYYLLVHLNMFGEAYGPAVDTVLRKYVP